jgi:hypothetical protein
VKIVESAEVKGVRIDVRIALIEEKIEERIELIGVLTDKKIVKKDVQVVEVVVAVNAEGKNLVTYL